MRTSGRTRKTAVIAVAGLAACATLITGCSSDSKDSGKSAGGTSAGNEKITLHMAVPTIFQMWRDSESFARVDLSATRMALCGGAPCPLPLIDAYRERGVLFRQGYGLTEVGPNCFSLTPEDTFRKGWPEERPPKA